MRPIDADALVDAMTGACNIFDAHGVDTTLARTLITIADKAPTIGGWISVKDRLPEPEENVLIFTKTGCLKYAQYHDKPYVANPWYVYEDQARAWTNVISHWMPLPEPPKEDQQ